MLETSYLGHIAVSGVRFCFESDSIPFKIEFDPGDNLIQTNWQAMEVLNRLSDRGKVL